jgi:hypothetical protein
MTKDKIINEFLATLNDKNCNKVEGDKPLLDAFGKGKPFSIVCNSCLSFDIETIGEQGIDYGGQTGYSSGSTVIKCNSCGTAVTYWE